MKQNKTKGGSMKDIALLFGMTEADIAEIENGNPEQLTDKDGGEYRGRENVERHIGQVYRQSARS